MSGEHLARRAASAPGWSFMPGVSYWYPARWFGDRDMLVRVSDRPDHAEALNRERTGAEALPDLDDHATLGCIEHGMLPAAWGLNAIVRVMVSGGIASIEVFSTVGGGRLFHIEDEPIGEALVACLEAAAERRVP